MKKVKDILGKDTVEDMDKMSHDDLKNKVVQAEQSMEEAKKELELNPKYQELKESLLAITQSVKDLNKRQKAVIKYALSLLN